MPQNEKTESTKNPQKIVQTAGRVALGEFAPDFAHFNDDILFGENWNNHDINLKTRCIITVVSLMSQGITDSSLKYHLENAKKNGVTKKRDCRGCHPRCVLCRLAEILDGFQSGKAGLGGIDLRSFRRRFAFHFVTFQPLPSGYPHFANRSSSALAPASGFRSLAVDCSAGATIPKLKFIMAKNRNQCYIYSKH